MRIELTPTDHVCTGSIQGEWVVHKCTECDYTIQINTVTSEKKEENYKYGITHSGTISYLLDVLESDN